MKKIYYFSPEFNWEHFDDIPKMSEQECEQESRQNSEVTCYDPKEFEFAFNFGVISDEGFIRIF
jgi:hypothetical protein